jgi:hypothetical protein
MRCKKFKEKIILNLYGELSEEEKSVLESHLQECAECSRDLEYTKKVFKAVEYSKKEKTPEANWERAWKGISSAVEEKPKRQLSLLLLPKWAYAAAALAFVFALGIIIGSLWFPPLQKGPLPQKASLISMDQSLQEHFESLKPVLTEYANYSPSDERNGIITIDEEILESLLLQNYLLKTAVSSQKNPALQELLEDVDLILREVTNLRNGDRPTLSLIKDTINQRDILFKMEIFQKI